MMSTRNSGEPYVVNYASKSVSVIDTATNKVNATVPVGEATVPVGEYPIAIGQCIGPVTKSNSTMESNSTPFLNPINRTENQTNNTGMVDTGTVSTQVEKSENIPEPKNAPFISPIWVLTVVLGAVTYVRKTK
jgi:YVTN family beta-propeller protein